MARRMEWAYCKGGGGPDIRVIPHATAATFLIGDVVKYSSGELVEATAAETGAVIVGVAAQSVNTNPGYDNANSPTVITGRDQTTSVWLATRRNVFRATLVNNSDTSVACTQANVGISYGFRIISAGVWAIDKNITATNNAATIVGFDPNETSTVFFTFDAADSTE